MVGDYINAMKTTFDLKLDLYQAFKQLGYTKTWKQREAVEAVESFSQNLNKKVVFIALI